MNQVYNTKRKVVGSRSGVLGGWPATQVSSGATQGETSRQYQISPVPVNAIKVAFGNWYMTPAGEAVGPNDITVKAAVEFPNGSGYAAGSFPLFFNGQRSVVIQPGATVECSAVGFTIPANTPYWIRTYVSVANAGERWPLGRFPTASSPALEGLTPTNVDAADGTGLLPGSVATSGIYGPIRVTGIPLYDSPSVGVIGDSLAAGTGDQTGIYQGYIERGLGSKVHWMSGTRAGVAARNYTFPTLKTRSTVLMSGEITTLISEVGSNDIYNLTRTIAECQNYLREVWNDYQQCGVKVIQCTITPRTTSTDGWITSTNQTISNTTLNQVRLYLNDWLRQLPNGIEIFDVADLVECNQAGTITRNGSYWRVDQGVPTADGTHPSALMAEFMKQSIDLTKVV